MLIVYDAVVLVKPWSLLYMALLLALVGVLLQQPVVITYKCSSYAASAVDCVTLVSHL